MADTTKGSPSPLIHDLLSHCHEFTFNQIMRLARMHFGAGGQEEVAGVPWRERVRVRPDLSLGFPAADAARGERTGADGADLLVTATFFGLYGSSSPLPTHYTEDLLDEAAADSTVRRDFLDILHQRLYHLYFQCWSKYRLAIKVAEEENTQDLERLYCLIGLGGEELRGCLPDARSLLCYAGLFTQTPRSAQGLQALLKDALGICKLEVEQCVLRLVPIPEDQQMRLGMVSMCQGVNTVLGNEIADRMGKFRIHIGPLSKKEFDSVLPGTPGHAKLARLIRAYILDPFDFDVKLILAAGEAEPIRLGDRSGPRLGLDSWCFSGDTLGEVCAYFPIAHSAAQAPAAGVEDRDATLERQGPSTLIGYYQEELSRLRDLAAEYVKAHPEQGSLVSGDPADPSIERLFEGVAFLNANLLLKINDDIPEIIHDVIHAIQPNHLRPVPATTVIIFSPKRNCTGPQVIPVGTELRSVPVDGTACRFTTRYPVEIHPLTLTDVSFSQPSGKPAAITLSLKLRGIALSQWNIKSLRLFLAGEYRDASNLYLVLMRYLKRIVIGPLHGGQSVTLDATHVKAVGFDDTEVLLPSEAPGAACHQRMHEFFIQPDKFLFLDLHGWETWRGRGEGAEFEICFELVTLPFTLHKVSIEDFALFATPAVNLFKHLGEPIAIDNQHTEYQIVPSDGNLQHYYIYSVEHVAGLFNNTNRKISFKSSRKFNPQSRTAPTYHVEWRNAVIGNGLDAFLSVEIPPQNGSNRITTLLVDLACTNGILPERLEVGDICKDTDNSPNFAGFTNCRRTTRCESIDGSITRFYTLDLPRFFAT